MESEQYEEAVRDYENLLKSNKGNMEYRYLDNSLLMKFPFSKLKFTFLVRIELYNGNGPYLRDKMLFNFIYIFQTIVARGKTGVEKIKKEGLLQNSWSGKDCQ